MTRSLGPPFALALALVLFASAGCARRVGGDALADGAATRDDAPDAAASERDSGSPPRPDDAGETAPSDSGPPTPREDAGDGPTPTDSGPATPPSAVISVDGCDAPSASCVCTAFGPPNACTHTNGGVYANLGCSGGYQCCDGAFRKGLDVCGPCLCTDPTGVDGCTPPDDATALCHPVFEGSAQPIPADVQAEMTGLSWKPELDCPAFADLRLVRVSHWDFDGGVREGELVVAASVADDVIAAFAALFEARFPIERMTRVDAYGADDDASMAANNTSAFNCRLTTSGTRLSDHSYGTAIDINPLRNPYVTSGGTVYPPAGAPFVDRANVRKGMIGRPGPVVDAFAAIGWGWGGDWRGTKDYQHVSESGQ